MRNNKITNMANTINMLYKSLLFCAIAISSLFITSCDKEQKKYDGDAQLAFSNSTYSATITTQKNSVTIPIQLIANGYVDASGTIAVDPLSTCANAVSFTPQFTIDPATFSYNLVIAVDYNTLKTGKNTLILKLESPMKIAKYYGTATITLTK